MESIDPTQDRISLNWRSYLTHHMGLNPVKLEKVSVIFAARPGVECHRILTKYCTVPTEALPLWKCFTNFTWKSHRICGTWGMLRKVAFIRWSRNTLWLFLEWPQSQRKAPVLPTDLASVWSNPLSARCQFCSQWNLENATFRARPQGPEEPKEKFARSWYFYLLQRRKIGTGARHQFRKFLQARWFPPN